MIGSIAWRIYNYGFVATLRYWFTRKRTFSVGDSPLETLTIEELLELLELQNLNVSLLNKNIESYMQLLRKDLELASIVDIKPVLSQETTVSRLLLLDILIRNFKFDYIIETGTQHGVSTSIMSQVAREIPSPPRIISYDVDSPKMIRKEDNVEYITLECPVRKNFVKHTSTLNQSKGLFFHDSDHTYENMTFEFNFAWKNLRVETIIADDIEGNSAFSDFCRNNQLRGFIVMIGKGPVLGFVSRGLKGIQSVPIKAI